jgi:hypothetical protein
MFPIVFEFFLSILKPSKTQNAAIFWQVIIHDLLPGPRKRPKVPPGRPPENSTPEAHLSAQSIQRPLKH